jgi:hypothetical protein
VLNLFLVKEALESVRIETGHTLTLKDYFIALLVAQDKARRKARREAKKRG